MSSVQLATKMRTEADEGVRKVAFVLRIPHDVFDIDICSCQACYNGLKSIGSLLCLC